MQNNNLLKKAMLALLLCVAMPYVNAQVAHIGDILCTTGVYVSPAEFDDSGLEAMGVIFYVDATGQHGWAVALEDAGVYYWMNGTGYSPLPDYNSVRAAIYDLDGMFNTQEVLNYVAANNTYSFPAFEAMDVANGWYLPAIGQLNYLYGNIVEVNTGLVSAGGVAFDMVGSWRYWSSTEFGGLNAWHLNSSGKVDNSQKNTSNGLRVRGVHNF